MSTEKEYSKLTFKAFTTNEFVARRKSVSGDSLEYTVQINPQTIERTFSPVTPESKQAKKSNSSGGDGGLNPETYKFDLYFDGTGVAGAPPSGKSFSEDFQLFLDTVYAYTDDKTKKKEASFVIIYFGNSEFPCKLSSMTASYLLFSRNGTPLRIKVSCTFSSVEKEKPGEKKTKRKAGVQLSLHLRSRRSHRTGIASARPILRSRICQGPREQVRLAYDAKLYAC